MGEAEEGIGHPANEAVLITQRSERIEFENLQIELKNRMEAWKMKENRLIQNHDRARRRVQELEARNRELLEEVKVLEQERALYFGKSKPTTSSSAAGNGPIPETQNKPKTSRREHEEQSPNVVKVTRHEPLTADKSSFISCEISTEDLDVLQAELELGLAIEVC
jgi:hypothetical protein